jgi:hypothetical protein
VSEGNAPKNEEPILGFSFPTKNDMTTLGHPPYSPHLAPADFCLFPRLKSALMRRRFCDATEIIKNATKELKSLSHIDFQECFQHPYSR